MESFDYISMMQKIRLIAVFCMLIYGKAYAQVNLVPNSDFEDTLACPYFVSQIDYANHWITTKYTPDYFHSCNNTSTVNTGWVGVPVNARGYQPAHSGEAYAGIVSYYGAQPDYREAFHTQLTQLMVTGETYQVGMWVILMEDYARWAIDGGIGIYISNDPINPAQYFTYTPQIMNPPGNVLNDSLNWTLISGSYTATGGENYITIGGFLPDSMLAFFDRGSGSGYDFTTYAIEDVFVLAPLGTAANSLNEDIQFNAYPNPFTDQLHITSGTYNAKVKIEIFNVLGEMVITMTGNTSDITIPASNLSPGIYNVCVKTGNSFFVERVIKQE
jgi:hypothetical protein